MLRHGAEMFKRLAGQHHDTLAHLLGEFYTRHGTKFMGTHRVHSTTVETDLGLSKQMVDPEGTQLLMVEPLREGWGYAVLATPQDPSRGFILAEVIAVAMLNYTTGDYWIAWRDQVAYMYVQHGDEDSPLRSAIDLKERNKTELLGTIRDFGPMSPIQAVAVAFLMFASGGLVLTHEGKDFLQHPIDLNSLPVLIFGRNRKEILEKLRGQNE